MSFTTIVVKKVESPLIFGPSTKYWFTWDFTNLTVVESVKLNNCDPIIPDC